MDLFSPPSEVQKLEILQCSLGPEVTQLRAKEVLGL